MSHSVEKDAALVEEWAGDDALMLAMGKFKHGVQGPISDRLAATIAMQARASVRNLAAALRSRALAAVDGGHERLCECQPATANDPDLADLNEVDLAANIERWRGAL